MYITIKVDDKDVVKVVSDNNTQAGGLVELAKSALDKWFALKSAIKEFERVENENTELRECIKNFLGWWDREDNSTPPHDTENPQKYVDAMRSSLEGGNHVQMRKEINE